MPPSSIKAAGGSNARFCGWWSFCGNLGVFVAAVVQQLRSGLKYLTGVLGGMRYQHRPQTAVAMIEIIGLKVDMRCCNISSILK
jgi:hypothetical protein